MKQKVTKNEGKTDVLNSDQIRLLSNDWDVIAQLWCVVDMNERYQ